MKYLVKSILGFPTEITSTHFELRSCICVKSSTLHFHFIILKLVWLMAVVEKFYDSDLNSARFYELFTPFDESFISFEECFDMFNFTLYNFCEILIVLCTYCKRLKS